VVVAGTRDRPQVLARSEIALADPGAEGSGQPFHAAFGTLEKNERRLASRITEIRRIAELSVASVLRDWAASGWTIQRAALVVGSLNPPEAIANEHIRAHALEGQLFRTVLQDALSANGVQSDVMTERTLYGEASEVLEQNVSDLKSAVSLLGHSIGRPWQADHKLAATAAWMRLS